MRYHSHVMLRPYAKGQLKPSCCLGILSLPLLKILLPDLKAIPAASIVTSGLLLTNTTGQRSSTITDLHTIVMLKSKPFTPRDIFEPPAALVLFSFQKPWHHQPLNGRT